MSDDRNAPFRQPPPTVRRPPAAQVRPSPPGAVDPPPAPPLLASPPPASPVLVPPEQARRGLPMWARHLIGAVGALVLTPIGIAVLDSGEGYFGDSVINDNADEPVALVMFLLGMALLALVAASSRFTGLGPVVAGLVWGVVPLLGSVMDSGPLYEFSEELPDSLSATHFYSALAALLIGAGISGRWSRRRA